MVVVVVVVGVGGGIEDALRAYIYDAGRIKKIIGSP
jgi:hypothetical protein